MHDDLVVGGGIAGLTKAWALRRAGREVCLLEAGDRVGGLIDTSVVDGVVVERGPQTLQTTPEVLALVDALGLADEVVAPAGTASRRFVVRAGRLVPLPHGPGALWSSPHFGVVGALRLMSEPALPRRRSGPETVDGFVRRRFGSHAAALVDPFVAGVFGGDPRELEVDSAFPDLVAAESSHGSVLLGMVARMRTRAKARPSWTPAGGMFTFLHGLGTLPRALERALGPAVRTNTPALSLTRVHDAWVVRTPDGEVRARRVWLACPLPTASRLLGASDLAVPTSPIAAVHLGFRTEDVDRIPQGFGWLMPSGERTDVLGCLWVSSVFPGHAPGRVVVRVMLGGSRAPHLPLCSPASLVAHARQVIAEVQDLRAEPLFTDVAAYPEGIPQYTLGHAAKVADWRRRWPDVALLGWATTGVGVSACVRAGLAD